MAPKFVTSIINIKWRIAPKKIVHTKFQNCECTFSISRCALAQMVDTEHKASDMMEEAAR